MEKGYKFSPEDVRVLIVDDQDNMRKAMKKLVSSMGIKKIVEAHDGIDAISECELAPFDLILCDLYMRKMNGIGVLKYIRSRQIANEIPFVLVTGEASREDIVNVADHGADAYILKPFHIQEFEEKIAAVLNSYHSPSIIVTNIRECENLILEKRYQESIQKLTRILETDPKSARARHNIAICLTYLNKHNEAERYLAENIKAAPDYYRNYTTLGNIMLRAKDYPNAIKAMTKELELHPKQPKRQNQIATLLLRDGQFEKAKEHLREALKENSKYKPALLSMGKVFAESDDLEKALYYFKRVRRYHPKETNALNLAVKYCLNKKEKRKAEYFLKDEIGRYKDRMDARVILAKLYINDARDEEAEEILKFVIQEEENNISALKILGSLYMKQGKFDNAEAIFKEIIRIDSKHFEGLLYLAEACLKQSKLKSCQTAIHKAMTIDSNHPKLLYLYGYSLVKSKQFHKAYFILIKSINSGKASTAAQDLLKECSQMIKKKRYLIHQQRNSTKAIAS